MFLINIPKSLSDLSKNRIEYFTFLITYLLGFELLARLAKASPFIPYEAGKYLLVILTLIGLLLTPRKLNRTGILLLVCILPAALYDLSGQRLFSNLIDDLFGPLGLSLGVMLWGGWSMHEDFMHKILRLIWLASISALLYTFIKTPDFEDIEFTLRANFETSAGHASNQVATIFGLGMFLSFYAWLKKLKFSGYIIVDVIIGIAFTIQGLLTFSRGGMLVGAVAITIIFLTSRAKKRVEKSNQKFSYIRTILIGLALYSSFIFVNDVTGGKLSLRYSGETQGTLDGSQDKTIDKVTSGRFAILKDDINLWSEYPITGVGAGAGRYLKEGFGFMKASHLEATRLLCEHGLLGLSFLIILGKAGLDTWRNRTDIAIRDILFTLFIIAILTSFHAGMRTYVTPFLITLSSMKARPNSIFKPKVT